MINIAVLGYGTVGSGVVEVINTNHESINKRAGDEINIKYVLDLRDFPGDPVEKVLVHDYEVIVNDPEVDIVVEVMGGIEPAYTFVKRALQAGKSVSTSNKALVAKHGSELMEIAKEKNIRLTMDLKLKKELNIQPADWCAIFGNALDNAIEACEKVEKGKRFINVVASCAGSLLKIKIENAMQGSLNTNGNVLETTKKRKEYHGFGLKNIEKTVQRYDGIMELTTEKGTFIMQILLCDIMSQAV